MKRQKAVRMGLRANFFLGYVAFMLVILSVTGITYYTSTWRRVYDFASDNLLSIVEKNCQITDQKLLLVAEYANGLTVDKDISTCLNHYQQASDTFEYFMLDREIRDILSKYFLYCDSILSVNLVTSNIVYGYTGEINVIPVDTFRDSRVYRDTMAANGKTVWIPTYDFFDQYRQNYIRLERNAYQYVFTASKLIRAMEDDYAVLVINFLENVVSEPFLSEQPAYIDQFAVITPEGEIVTHSDHAMLAQTVSEPWIAMALERGSGVAEVHAFGRDRIVAFARSQATGWLSCVFTTQESLMDGFMISIARGMIVPIALIATVCMAVLALLSRGVLKPMLNLQKGFSHSGRGRFDELLPEAGIMEMRGLIRSFNRMNQKISQLIHDNYQMVILREKQELSMYNLQVNPHFVLNSLNIINLELLKKGEDDLSEMISKMASIMDYTLNTQAVMVPFWMDWEHTLAYMDIMRKRYGGQFTYRLDIQPDLREQLIPKFLLQPLIENAILKGNRNVSGPFRIEIHAGRCPEGMLFEVTDNGKGISEEKRREILDKKPSEGAQHAGGINNVRYRIQCIYGEQYDISIESEPYVKTRIIIRLPLAPRLPVTP